ncbi:MAG TPA: dihydrolipoamide acetyltransferase family protein [Polyangiaceae bacterium]|jgi:pyruvate dehydrogenase E2 component (dihydrolipoamide acetyltransferase)
MARWEFKLPDIGEGITEGEIVGWLVKVGDPVVEDQPMVEVMTDKATVTITAPKAGTVVETHGKIGEIVRVHAVLVVFELEEPSSGRVVARDRRAGVNGAVSHEDDGPAATAVGDLKEVLPGIPAAQPASAASASPGYFNEKPLATPATRKLARDMNVDLRRIAPTGPQGRVTKRDLESFARGQASAHEALAPAPEVAAPPAARAELEERVPFAGLRRKIAQKMALSKQKAAHYTLVEECDVTELKAMRARLMAPADAQGVKLTFLPFIVKATAAALKKHPMLNTTLDEAKSELVFRRYVHIGVATSTEAGLLVVVVRDADRKSILDIARDIERLAADARAGKSKVEDLVGSTFTVTSPGAQGGLLATPIINYPEVAILGVHRMRQRPVVKDGQIVIGDVMLLSLSFDHRIVDGRVGAAFAYEVIAYLEQPDRLMLEMA